MEIRLNIPPGGLVQKVRAYDTAGNEVEVDRIVIEPLFNRAGSRPEILFGATVIREWSPEEEEIQKFALAVSGATGKVQVVDKTKSVLSELEQKSSGADGPASQGTPPPPAQPSSDDYTMPTRKTK